MLQRPHLLTLDQVLCLWADEAAVGQLVERGQDEVALGSPGEGRTD